MIKHLTILLLLLGASLLSDAQDNNKPHIKRVSVEPLVNFPGNVFIEWTKTDLGNEINYIVIRSTGGGNPETTQLFYNDRNASANEESIGYRIVAQFPNSNPVDGSSDVHNTVFLFAPIYDTCAKPAPAIKLLWTAYGGWDDNVEYYIYIKEGANDFEPQGPTSSHDFEVVHLTKETQYKFYVEARNTQNGLTSKSNIQNLFTDIPQPIDADEIFINNVVNTGSNSLITFHTNSTNPDVFTYILQKSTSSNFLNISNVDTLTEKNNTTALFDVPHNIAPVDQFYRIQTLNKCGNIPDAKNSNSIRPINLIYAKKGNTLTFNWNSCFNGESEQYQLFEDGIAYDAESSTEYVVNIETYPSNQEFCYHVEAQTATTNYTATSNTVCFRKLPTVVMYDAFTPNGDGKNDHIKPLIDPPVKEFEFVVYNHYGTQVFVMDKHMFDIKHVGWDGAYNGKKVTEGAYPYYYRIVTDKGDIIENRGLIEVVYP